MWKFDGQDHLTKEYAYSIYPDIDTIKKDWDSFVGEKDIFLHSSYLLALQNAPSEKMKFLYTLIWKKGELKAVAYLQIQHFNAGKSIQSESSQGEKQSIFAKAANCMKDHVAQRIDYHAVICGNLLLTGEHGVIFHEDVDKQTELAILSELLDHIMDNSGSLSLKNINLSLIKDYYQPLRESALQNDLEHYFEFCVQPNMVMSLDSQWQQFSDYLIALNSKYRIRVKRARKKLEGLKLKNLSLSEIEENLTRIKNLHEQVVQDASFNLLKIDVAYFSHLKRNLGDDFQLYAYFNEEEKMVAFYSTIKNGQDIEAHFLGFDKDVNRDFHVYHNILLDIIDEAIKLRSDRIIFARTGTEIKSSVGAVGTDMYCYLKHRKKFQNAILPTLTKFLNTKEVWEKRNPFKNGNGVYEEAVSH